MRAFRDLSIGSKLMLIIMVTSSVASLLACAAFISHDLYTFRSAKVSDLTTVADIIGSNSTAALTFNDANSAREILAGLSAKKHIVAACIYGRDGQVFAKYLQGNPNGDFSPPAARDDGSRFENNQLVLFRKIVVDGEKIGTVCLQSDLSEVRERLHRYAAVLFLVALGSSLVALLVSSNLQRAISEPIRTLAWTTKMVGVQKNYSIRAVKKSEDELGLLIEGFNEMLEQIERRDTALLRAHDELEKRVEERTAELQASEQRFGLLSVSSPVGTFQTDAQGRWNYANERWQAMSELTLEQSLGEGWAQALPPEDREAVVERWSRTAREGREFLLEFRVCTPKGNLRWVRCRAAPIRSNEGEIAGYVGTLADITEGKRAEEALQESEERTRLLLDSTAEAIYGIDMDGNCTFCNAATLRLLGYQHPNELLGKNMHALIHHTRPDGTPYPSEECRTYQAFRRGEGTHVDDEVLWRADGTSFPVEFWSYPIRRGGEVVGAVMTFVDITERRRAEDDLQRAKEAAEAANRAKSDFLANMSHEIRTPMNGILGMTELALDTDLNPEQREYLGMVKTSADSLLRVINDILDFSKIEAGKLDLDQVEFNLRDALGETLKTLAIRAHKKHLELSYWVQADVPDSLVGDPGRLRQLVVNLVGNAIKFTERGEVVVRAEVESQTSDTMRLHFVVSDTGIGISGEEQRLIFEPFAQADGSMTRRHGGTGLGLTISKRLVELMGGRVWVESEPGHGSAFHFTANFGLTETPAPGALPLEAATLENLPALVVDDNATNRQILEEMLTNWRMAPRAADEGRAALAAMEEACGTGRAFRLVLLDVHMSDLDGFAVAEQIKRNPELAGATIMMLTSDRQRGDAARCQELGIAAYLTKPITQSELLDAILLALGQRPQVSPAVERVASPPPRTAKRLRILLAEDNLVNQGLAVRLLEKRGHVAVVTRNGREALEALEKSSFRGFDAVLMDVQMPETDGLEATVAIRAWEKAHEGHIPIIAMTAHALKGDRERCLEAGMDGYVAKPIRAADLLGEVERCVPKAPVELPEPVGAPQSAPGEVLDCAALLEHMEGDPELLAEMVGLFLQDCPQLLAALREALARGDAGALRRAAHTLKGTVSNFAAPAATAAALRLERMGREGDLSQAAEGCAALETEIERLKPLLANLCQEVAR